MVQWRGRVSCVVLGVVCALGAGCVEETEEEARARCGRLPYECARRACIREAGFGHGEIQPAVYMGPMVFPGSLMLKEGEREAASELLLSFIDAVRVERLEVSPADWLTVEHEGDAPPFIFRRTEPPRRVVVRRADGVSRGRSATLRWVVRGMCGESWSAMEVKVWEARP